MDRKKYYLVDNASKDKKVEEVTVLVAGNEITAFTRDKDGNSGYIPLEGGRYHLFVTRELAEQYLMSTQYTNSQLAAMYHQLAQDNIALRKEVDRLKKRITVLQHGTQPSASVPSDSPDGSKTHVADVSIKVCTPEEFLKEIRVHGSGSPIEKSLSDLIKNLCKE